VILWENFEAKKISSLSGWTYNTVTDTGIDIGIYENYYNGSPSLFF
jgi:hypothetical protein